MNANDEQAIKEGCTYHPDLAQRAVNFIERYCIPSTLGKTIVLLPWQKHIVQQLFGWKDSQGKNRFRRATISTAKKNGKTLLQSSIATYALLGGLSPSPFVASCSTSRENASQIYRELAYTVRNNDNLNKICKCLDSTKEIKCKSKSARYRSFSADAGSSEGENLSLCIVDECHAMINDRLYRSLEYSTIARPESCFINISTAGHDQSHFFYDIFRYALAVQRDEVIDTSLLAFVATPDDNDDLDSPTVWAKANPSMGISFSEQDFARDNQRAKQGGVADLISFYRYRCNSWQKSEDSYMLGSTWDKCKHPMTDDELKPYPAYIGIDLSGQTDPCSVSIVHCLPDNNFYIQCHSWVCEAGVKAREKSNLPQYRLFQAEGVMTITPGGLNDYRSITRYLAEARAKYKIKEVVFDTTHGNELVISLQKDGVKTTRFAPHHKSWTSPLKEFSIAVEQQRIRHNGGRFLRWCMINTRLDCDRNGNVKCDKETSTDKIDGTISTIQAYARAAEASIGTRNNFLNRGVIWV